MAFVVLLLQLEPVHPHRIQVLTEACSEPNNTTALVLSPV